MTLSPDRREKGLWRSTSAPQAGVQALVIGISRYPYLSEQLEVSAKTAAKVLNWLKNQDKIGGVPIATCRVLLAPNSDEERAEVEAVTGGWYGEVTFASLATAIKAWGKSLTTSSQAGTTVAFFFYSGHGAEHVSHPSLFASDILDPTDLAAGPQNAISFNNLWMSIRTYGVESALFFVDACRNAPEFVKRNNIRGKDVLDALVDPPSAPKGVVWLQATRMGRFAYQDPNGPATIFGQALLEALEGMPPDHQPYDRSSSPWALLFSPLESHVKQRVRELLTGHDSGDLQAVEPGGVPYNGDQLVAHKTPPAGTPAAAGPPPHKSPVGPGLARLNQLLAAGVIDTSTRDLVNWRSNAFMKAFREIGPALVNVLGTHTTAYMRQADDSDHLRRYDVMHEVFGHEHVTIPWIRTLQLLDLRSGQPAPAGTVKIADAHRQEAGNRVTAWLDVWVEPGPGSALWIGAGGAAINEPSIAITVPRDAHVPLPVRLDVAFSQAAGHGLSRLQSLTARLAPPNNLFPEAKALWQPLWDVQKLEAMSDLGTAGKVARQLDVLKDALADKGKSPVGAAIGAALLLRVNALDALRDWPRNLANWFPWLAEGPILWAETLLRRAEGSRRTAAAARHEARGYFATLAERGPPLLRPVLAMAARQAELWRGELANNRIPANERQAVERACLVVDRAAAYALADGIFAAHMSELGVLTPATILEGVEPLAKATQVPFA